jgi:hypothetical protein
MPTMMYKCDVCGSPRHDEKAATCCELNCNAKRALANLSHDFEVNPSSFNADRIAEMMIEYSQERAKLYNA